MWSKVRLFCVTYWLEFLLLCIALGNAEVLRAYLTSTGSLDTWQLTVAIYATEVLVACASMFGIPGLGVATVLFVTSLWSIQHQFGDQAIGHSYFSIAIYAGSIANYFRHFFQAKQNTAKVQARTSEVVKVNDKGQLDPEPLRGMNIHNLRSTLKISYNKARALKRILDDGQTVHTDWLTMGIPQARPRPRQVK